MDNSDPMTPSQDPGATGADPAAATNPQGSDGATDDSKTVTLSESDYKNLISQRDRANNNNVESESFLLTLAKEREIDTFLEQHKADYPDLTRDDLMSADDPAELEELAKSRQEAIERVVQKRLLDVQVSTAPQLSPQEKAAKLKALKQNPGSSSFQEMLKLQQS